MSININSYNARPSANHPGYGRGVDVAPEGLAQLGQLLSDTNQLAMAITQEATAFRKQEAASRAQAGLQDHIRDNIKKEDEARRTYSGEWSDYADTRLEAIEADNAAFLERITEPEVRQQVAGILGRFTTAAYENNVVLGREKITALGLKNLNASISDANLSIEESPDVANIAMNVEMLKGALDSNATALVNRFGEDGAQTMRERALSETMLSTAQRLFRTPEGPEVLQGIMAKLDTPAGGEEDVLTSMFREYLPPEQRQKLRTILDKWMDAQAKSMAPSVDVKGLSLKSIYTNTPPDRGFLESVANNAYVSKEQRQLAGFLASDFGGAVLRSITSVVHSSGSMTQKLRALDEMAVRRDLGDLTGAEYRNYQALLETGRTYLSRNHDISVDSDPVTTLAVQNRAQGQPAPTALRAVNEQIGQGRPFEALKATTPEIASQLGNDLTSRSMNPVQLIDFFDRLEEEFPGVADNGTPVSVIAFNQALNTLPEEQQAPIRAAKALRGFTEDPFLLQKLFQAYQMPMKDIQDRSGMDSASFRSVLEDLHGTEAYSNLRKGFLTNPFTGEARARKEFSTLLGTIDKMLMSDVISERITDNKSELNKVVLGLLDKAGIATVNLRGGQVANLPKTIVEKLGGPERVASNLDRVAKSALVQDRAYGMNLTSPEHSASTWETYSKALLNIEGQDEVNKKEWSKFGVMYSANEATLNRLGIMSPQEITKLTREQALNIYKTSYWRGHYATDAARIFVTDMAVNPGIGNARRILSNAGISLDDARWNDPARVHEVLKIAYEARKKEYTRIGGENLKGWLRRNEEVYALAQKQQRIQAGRDPSVQYEAKVTKAALQDVRLVPAPDTTGLAVMVPSKQIGKPWAQLKDMDGNPAIIPWNQITDLIDSNGRFEEPAAPSESEGVEYNAYGQKIPKFLQGPQNFGEYSLRSPARSTGRFVNGRR